MRSGRVRIPQGESRTIVYVPSGSSAVRYYRVFNSGRNKEKDITITGAGSAGIPVKPGESIDFGAKNDDIVVTAHTDEDAEVVYDYLG